MYAMHTDQNTVCYLTHLPIEGGVGERIGIRVRDEQPIHSPTHLCVSV